MNETLSDEDFRTLANSPFASKTDKALWQKALNTIEAKDAQIKQLVEALEYVNSLDIEDMVHGDMDEVIQKALSTIPNVEGYRLEQEVVNSALERSRCTGPDVPLIELQQASWKLHELCMQYEAHREEVKNDA